MRKSEVPRSLFNFMLDDALKDALEAIHDRDGISVSEQARRAIRAWIESMGVKVKGGKRTPKTKR